MGFHYGNGVIVKKTEMVFIPVQDNVTKEELIECIKSGNAGNNDSILNWDAQNTIEEIYHVVEPGDEFKVVFDGETFTVEVE